MDYYRGRGGGGEGAGARGGEEEGEGEEEEVGCGGEKRPQQEGGIWNHPFGELFAGACPALQVYPTEPNLSERVYEQMSGAQRVPDGITWTEALETAARLAEDW